MDSPFYYVSPLATFSGETNMALDLLFFHEFEGTILRFYQWEKPTLSFGKTSYIPEKINLELCDKLDIDKVKRPTGGKTVLHHQEITYSLCAPLEVFEGGILESYFRISKIISQGLLPFGLEVSFSPEKENLKSNNICFAEVSTYEIKANGKKLIGSAQKRSRKRLLQHGSLLLDVDFDLWSSVWIDADVKKLSSKVATLKEILGFIPEPKLICESIANAFCDSFQTAPKLLPIDQDLLLKSSKYLPDISNKIALAPQEQAP